MVTLGEVEIVFVCEIGDDVGELVIEFEKEFDKEGAVEFAAELDSLKDGDFEELSDKDEDLECDEVFEFEIEMELVAEIGIFDEVLDADIWILLDSELVLDAVFDVVFVVVGVFEFEFVVDIEGVFVIGINVFEAETVVELDLVLELDGIISEFEGDLEEL